MGFLLQFKVTYSKVLAEYTVKMDFSKRTNAYGNFKACLMGLWLLISCIPFSTYAATPKKSYIIKVVGLTNFAFFDEIKKVSNLYKKQNRLILSLSSLSRRAVKDTIIIKEALDSLGYRDSTVSYDLEGCDPLPRITLKVDLGDRYTIRKVRLREDQKPYKSIKKLFKNKFPLKAGSPATGKLIEGVEDDILYHLGTIGYPKARMTERYVTSNNTDKTVDVTYYTDLGPKSFFGEVTYTSLQQVDTPWAQNRVPWTSGDLYDSQKIDLLRERLRLPQLFNSITITEQEMTPEGQIPFEVKTSEGPRRYYGGKALYSTSEGLGGTAFWGHRNLFNSGQTLRIEAGASELVQGLKVHYSEPDFFKSNQTLFVALGGSLERKPAYKSLGGKLTLRLERAFDEKSKGSVGLEPDLRSVTQRSNQHTKFFRSLSVPMTLFFDRSNNLLDPKEGWRVATSLTPSLSSQGNKHTVFYKTDFMPTFYYSLNKEHSKVFALRALAGGIWGTSLRNIPGDKRFYSGGSDSIRGYGFQRVGPFKNGKPIGGRGLYELSFEFRWKVTGNWSAVPFVEAGNIIRPTFKETLHTSQVGVGLGVRYNVEGLGPVRVDLAFPIIRRKNDGKRLDDFFQFYAGIGQAF